MMGRLLARCLLLVLAILPVLGAEAVRTTGGGSAITLAMLRAMDPDCGFHLLQFNGRTIDRIRLDRLVAKDGQLVVGAAKPGLPSFLFEIREAPRHLSLTLKKTSGDFRNRSLGLQFTCRAQRRCEVVPIDYMVVNTSRMNEVVVSWPYLWNANPEDPLGGFAVSWSGTPEENDRCLAEIWAQEALPHPAIGRPWTEAEVWKWIDVYHRTFAGLSETTLSASTSAELYALTDRMKAGGIRRIYLHTDTWRDEYWPVTRSFVEVNPKVFPGGRADLKKYSEYVHRNGMLLRLHNVSGGIGRKDPELVRQGNLDPRLESWFRGRLEKPLGADAQEIVVRPDAGVHVPQLRLGEYWQLGHFTVDHEIIRIAEIIDSDGPLWTLKVRTRAMDDTPAAAHAVGAPVAGFYSAYGQNYIPDPKTDLMRIMAKRYADLINEAGLDHQHYDGAEIHCSEEEWGFAKFSFLVAQGVDHPTTSSTSGGVPSPWNIERRFSRIQRLKELNYFALALPVLLDGDRHASSRLDAHYEVASKLLQDARRLGLGKPEPMFGITQEMIETHGLVPDLLELIQRWRKVVFRLGDDDLAYLRRFLTTNAGTVPGSSGHHKSRDVPVLEERGGRSFLVPTRILCREALDAPWITGQEFGPVAPRQHVQPGGDLQLVNPYGPQVPGLIVHVLPAFAPAGAVPMPAATGGVAGGADDPAKARIDSYRTGTDPAHARGEAPAAGPRSTEGLWPQAISPQGLTQAVLEQDRIVLQARNPSATPYWSVEALPSWGCSIPLRGRRALQIDCEGDGSGAVLLVQLNGAGTRDYVITVDFTGPRRFVIPHGEASWNNAAWGWRMGAKHFDYAGTVNRVRLGFGWLPPQGDARVVVTGLALLENVATALHDPLIQVGEGTLAITGDVRSGEYLTYEAGEGVKVFDRNWRFQRALPAVAKGLTVQERVPFRIRDDPTLPRPWLEVQVLTRGPPQEIGTGR